jgi:hypothetical protein
MNPTYLMPHTIGTNVQSLWRSVCGNSVCSCRFPTVIGHVKLDTAVKYIPIIKNVIFIAVLQQAKQVQEFWCANCTEIPYLDREIK